MKYITWFSNYFKVLVGLTAFFILTGVGLLYASSQTRLPSSLSSSQECTPPCWHGIIPGETNPDEAYASLEKMSGVNKDTITTVQSGYGVSEIYWKFQRPVGDAAGYIYFLNGRVSAMTFLTANSMTISQAFKLMGQPEVMSTQVNQGFLDLLLISPQKGFLLDINKEIPFGATEQVVDIQQNTIIMHVSYFDPKVFEKVFTPSVLLDGLRNVKIEDLQPWTGLGKIQYKN